ncbi:LIM domain only protein 7 isoform X1 [Spea bombifrons]|uniref:LIM domain only protein 7 isoform X1 n=1 Tax=Spea bombifrons TaxID=233779 RepID=UPI00234BA653|nr:LIM domain only protein 7 isoform X1 [Spea bombifrons]
MEHIKQQIFVWLQKNCIWRLANSSAVLYISQDRNVKTQSDTALEEREYTIYTSDEEDDFARNYPNLVADDFYVRKVNLSSLHLKTPCGNFVPKFSTQEDEGQQKIIRPGIRARPWYNEFQGFSKRSEEDCLSAFGLGSVLKLESDVELCKKEMSQSGMHATPKDKTAEGMDNNEKPSQFLLLQALQKISSDVLSSDCKSKTDPTSGPRLVSGHQYLSHAQANQPEDGVGSVLPDLENDDLFARKTGTFHLNQVVNLGTPLAQMWELEKDIILQEKQDDSELPDLLKDDMTVRKTQTEPKEVRISGAPDHYHPVPFPEPWTLPEEIQSKFLCVVKKAPELGVNCGRVIKPSEKLKKDDMLTRKVNLLQGSNINKKPKDFVSGPCNEEDLKKWESIREASKIRHKKRQLVERLREKLSINDGSKSLENFSAEELQSLKQNRFEELQKFKSQIQEQDQKWQDDLAKWKNRRKSYTSDLQKKKEERDELEKIANEGPERSYKTFREMRQERESRDLENVYNDQHQADHRRLYSSNDDVFSDVTGLSKRALEKSYTIDVPYARKTDTTLHANQNTEKQERDSEAVQPKALPASTNYDGDASYTSKTSNAYTVLNTQTSEKDEPKLPSKTLSEKSYTVDLDAPSTYNVINSIKTYEKQERSPTVDSSLLVQQPTHSTLTTEHRSVRVSASLPRSYQKTDASRLSSVVAPRPFGQHSRGSTALTKSYTLDDSRKYNGDLNVPKIGSTFNTYFKAEGAKPTSSVQSEDNTDVGKENLRRSPSPRPVILESQQEKPTISESVAVISSALSKDFQQNRSTGALDQYSDMRISINQKPGSSNDFGFKTNWNSAGVFVTSVDRGSPAEFSQLHVDDEILSLNGTKVSSMDYSEWREAMDSALETGNLTIDVRRYGKNDWCRDPPSLSYKSHKTLNLTSMDTNILGSPESKRIDTSTTRSSNTTLQNDTPDFGRLKEARQVNGLQAEPSSKQKGSPDSTVLDVTVPTMNASTRWSWDPEEERKRQEKWHKEQEQRLQEKYRREQEKLREEWELAQKEADQGRSHQVDEEYTILKSSTSVTSHEPVLSYWRTGASDDLFSSERENAEQERQKEEAERLRKEREEEEERLRYLEEQRRQAEEAERQAKEEERRRRAREIERKQQEEEQRKREEEIAHRKRTEEEERQRREDEQRRKEESENLQRTYMRTNYTRFSKNFDEPDYSSQSIVKDSSDSKEYPTHGNGDYVKPSYGFANWVTEDEQTRKPSTRIQPSSFTSEAEVQRKQTVTQMRHSYESRGEQDLDDTRSEGESRQSLYKDQGQSGAELERQRIIQEMRKKAPLHNDNSWIRQRSSSVTKDTSSVPSFMRRGDSLDNLDSTSGSWRQSSWANQSGSHNSLSSSQDFGRPSSQVVSTSNRNYLRNPSSSLQQTSSGSVRSASLSQSSVSSSLPRTQASTQMSNQTRSKSVSGKKLCSYCNNSLGKGAAMIIESLGLCFHLHCFKCVACETDLGGKQSGAEVRIRNNDLYCNSCYIKFKSGQPTAM